MVNLTLIEIRHKRARRVRETAHHVLLSLICSDCAGKKMMTLLLWGDLIMIAN